MRTKMKRFLGIPLGLSLVLGAIPGMSSTAFAVDASQSGENAYVKYFATNQGFSAKGKDGDTWLSTTYLDEGYETAMKVDNGTSITFGSFAYGKECTQDDVTAYITAAVRGKSVLVTYAEQSRAWANCALFASCGALETEYNIRDG